MQTPDQKITAPNEASSSQIIVQEPSAQVKEVYNPPTKKRRSEDSLW